MTRHLTLLTLADCLASSLELITADFPEWQVSSSLGMWEAFWQTPDGRHRHVITEHSAGALLRRLRTLDKRPGLLSSSQTAALFRVHPRTVIRWAKAGRLSSVSTQGGSPYWFDEAEVRALLADEPAQAANVVPLPRR